MGAVVPVVPCFRVLERVQVLGRSVLRIRYESWVVCSRLPDGQQLDAWQYAHACELHHIQGNLIRHAAGCVDELWV